jgi:succinylglutamate desuccinylase
VTPETTTIDALDLMRSRKLGCLPGGTGREARGLVTESDFLDVSARLLTDGSVRIDALVRRQALATADLARLPRVLGVHPAMARRRQRRTGTLLFVVGGMHGNEPAGVRAMRTVFADSRARARRSTGAWSGWWATRGRWPRGKRFLRDGPEPPVDRRAPAGARGSMPPPTTRARPEAAEQRELLRTFLEHMREPWERVVLLDLHSTSAGGAPFTIISDTLQNRPVAFALPVPVLLGLEERIEGTLLSWFADQGHVALCLEGGQNDLPSTVDHHVAAIWLTLASAGLVAPEHLPALAAQRERLENSARDLPPVVELRYRFGIPDGAVFEMRPGFQNFQPVRRGEVLASMDPGSGAREVQSPIAGRVLMPRYQALGDDGFFLGREVRPFWLRLSGWLRRAGLAWVPRVLPGVRADRARPGELVVDRRIARWFPVEILHLFGYRWRSREGRKVRFVRRRDAS